MSTASGLSLPSPTSTTLGFGMVPEYPKSLLLSNNTLVNSILADIPFFSTGLLSFGVLTFFLILRQGNKFLWLPVISILVDFVAGLLDLSQLLERGMVAVQTGQQVAQVYPLIVAREVALSISPGVLFLFFWFFIGLPPRGELERPYGDRSYSRKLGIINYRDAYHSGRWDRWGFGGIVLRWALLAAVIAVPVLQIVGRIVAYNIPFSPLYNASTTLQIILSSLLMLKIIGNIWLSPQTPHLLTLRDYIPVLSCLMLGLGITVGNTLIFKFSETVLGRFLQAIEAYVLLVYILTASFYKLPAETPSLHEPAPASSPFVGVNINPSGSTFRISPPNVSTPDLAERGGLPSLRSSMYNRGSRNTLNRFSLWLTRGLSNRGEPEDVVAQHSASVRNGSPFQSENEKTQKYLDSYYFQDTSRDPYKGTQKTTNIQADGASDTSRHDSTTLPTAIDKLTVALDLKNRTSNRAREPEAPERVSSVDRLSPLPALAITHNISSASPVYGLQGLIRGDEAFSPSSSHSSGLSSLLRQQAELDKSVAGLQVYSDSADASFRQALGISPTQSDFSLSRFPEPPYVPLSENMVSDPPRQSGSLAGDDLVIDNIAFTLVPPNMAAVFARETGPGERKTSFPVSTRDSENSSLLIAGRNRMLGSNGTQYDVTSFIGGLTTPAGTTAIAPDTDAGQSTPIAIRLPEDELFPSPQTQGIMSTVQPLTIRSGRQARRPIPENSKDSMEEGATRRRNIGLPLRPNISAPLARISIEQPSAYERPRQPPTTVQLK